MGPGSREFFPRIHALNQCYLIEYSVVKEIFCISAVQYHSISLHTSGYWALEMWLVFLRNWIFNCGFFPPSRLLPLATISLFSVSITLFLFCYVRSFVLILDFYIGEIMPCFSFSVWLISLSIVSPRSIYVIANGKISFFFYGWLTVHHKFWNQGACCLQLCFSFSRWFWLSRVFLHTL